MYLDDDLGEVEVLNDALNDCSINELDDSNYLADLEKQGEANI